MKYQDILFEVADGVAWVTINRPETRNAFREHTLDELIDAFRSTRNDPSIACAVVTGAGDQAFSSGGDFHAMMRLNRANALHWNDRMLGLAMAIRGLPIPVIAMVNGWCMGGGHESGAVVRPGHRLGQRRLRPDRRESGRLPHSRRHPVHSAADR